MSLQARGGDEALLLGLAAGDEARVLPRLEVLGHRRRHHDHRRVGVLERRLPLLGLGVELLRVLDEVGRRGEQEVGVRQRLGELDLAVAVEVGLDALGLELRLGAEDRGLDQREEVARLLELLAGLGREAERHGALGVGAVGAGVDDHVVVGERRDAGDDALHLLVGRVGLDVGALELLDRGRDLLAVVLEQLRVVEVRRLGEVVVLLRVALEQLGRGHQAIGVLEQVVLDRRQIDVRGRGGRRLRRGLGRLVVVAPPQPTRARQPTTSRVKKRRMTPVRLLGRPNPLGAPNS